MPVPSEADINKKRKEYESNLKKLDEEGRIKEKLALSYMISAIRKEWMKSPTKLAILHEAMVPDMNPKTRTKWLYKCAICEDMFKGADVEVDHIIGEHSFTDISMFEDYWNNILRVPKSGLQVLCKVCHSIKTFSERYNCTWEEAVSKKKIILKMNQTAKQQKDELASYGYKPKDISNETLREQCYIELFDKGIIQ